MIVAKVASASFFAGDSVHVAPDAIKHESGRVLAHLAIFETATVMETRVKVRRFKGLVYTIGGAALGSVLGPAGTVGGAAAGAAFGGIDGFEATIELRAGNTFFVLATTPANAHRIAAWHKAARATREPVAADAPPSPPSETRRSTIAARIGNALPLARLRKPDRDTR